MAEVFNIGDHLAKTCTCGSVRFILLASHAVECAGCGAGFPVAWVWESEVPVEKELTDGPTFAVRDAARQLRKALGISQDFDDWPLEKLLLKAAERIAAFGVTPKMIEDQLAVVCLVVRHDYGLLSDERRAVLRHEARVWEDAFRKVGVLPAGMDLPDGGQKK